MSDDEAAAVRILKEFIGAMQNWESEMLRHSATIDWPNAKQEELELHSAQMRRRLAEIFERYCEAGRDAERVNDVLHCGGGEPDYNAQTERITSVVTRGRKVVVETHQAHNFRHKLRYELVQVDGRWKVRDNRKCSFEYETRWRRWPL